jgi:hypothetical protein
LVVRGKASTPVVVLMRGGCIRCAWPVDGARGAPAACEVKLMETHLRWRREGWWVGG